MNHVAEGTRPIFLERGIASWAGIWYNIQRLVEVDELWVRGGLTNLCFVE